MKKLTSILLAMVMIGTLFAGCGSGDSGRPALAAGVGDGPVPITEEDTLRVLNYFDLSAAGALEEQELVWDAFEKAHPNIKIEREDEFEDSFHNSIEAYAAAGNLPDVMYVWPSGRSTTLHTQRLLKDLSPLIARDGLDSMYIPAILDPNMQIAGYMGMIPQGVTATNMFIINHEVLDAVGLKPATTYSEMVAQVPILRDAGYETLIMPNQADWVMQSCLFSAVVGRFMGYDWHERINNGLTDFNDPAFIASLAFIQRLYTDGVLAPSSLVMDYGEGPGLFANNVGAYYVDGDWRTGAFITDQTTGDALIATDRQKNFSITVFPEIDLPGVVIPGRTNSVVLGTGWGINANLADGSPELEAAWTLVKWLVGLDVQTFRFRTGGISTPSVVGIDIHTLPLEPLQITALGLSGEYDIPTVVLDGAFEGPVYNTVNPQLQALGLGTTTPVDAARIIQDAFEAWQATQ
jgi:raffinose/stachyose/melibiose transport system substrate-binding protein